LDSVVVRRIEQLVAGLEPPVDLHRLAEQARVLAVEECEMIPEAVIAHEAGGFRIYLQSNFKDLPGAVVRRRFSLAHEIAHTLFFEDRDGEMKPRMGAPTGERLEASCNQAAGLILVPAGLLNRELRDFVRPWGAECLGRLSERFGVSVEVLLRRLNTLESYSDRFAPVLLRCQPTGQFAIEYAVSAPWLKVILTQPQRGQDFLEWFYKSRSAGEDCVPHVPRDPPWERRTSLGLLVATPVDLTASLRIVELRLL